ncbi:related to AOS1 - Smt3p activating protein [Ustilago trichophora]|uniref:Related to AOS1 - Smt3p activating protein n=1 Tax=Ustilago trichophora TaxID=86804 RepID=A0A5C3DW10_9BASI|nr:related to AOS1 - Smt3p activating protein [Ustilago trichophora]
MTPTTSSAAASASQAGPTTQPQPSSSVTKDINGAVTEDEAALYDRQIRLWGLEAQNRLRTAHILIVGWNGIATETIKNTVLSGIGSITILDPTLIDASTDLLSGFFFRDEEVGQPKCSSGPLDRVRSLNPLVKVTGVHDASSYETFLDGGEPAQTWLKDQAIDVVVAGTPLPTTPAGGDGLMAKLITMNQTTRAAGLKFFLSGTYGFGGFYFADQITHDYLVERAAPPPTATTTTTTEQTEKKRIKQRQTFTSLSDSLSYTWTGLTDRQQRRIRPPLDWFVWLALCDLESRLGQTWSSSSTSISANALKDRTVALIREKGFKPELILGCLAGAETDSVFESIVKLGGTGATLAPVGSVLGGLMAQDILNSISGREEPVVNWIFLHMDASGSATVHRIGDLTNAVVVD